MTLCIEPAGMNARVYWRETEDDDDPQQGWYWVEVDDEGHAIGSPAGPYQSAITAGSEARQRIIERASSEAKHCPACGYTPADCATHLDHHLCSRYPFFQNEIGRESASKPRASTPIYTGRDEPNDYGPATRAKDTDGDDDR